MGSPRLPDFADPGGGISKYAFTSLCALGPTVRPSQRSAATLPPEARASICMSCFNPALLARTVDRGHRQTLPDNSCPALPSTSAMQSNLDSDPRKDRVKVKDLVDHGTLTDFEERAEAS